MGLNAFSSNENAHNKLASVESTPIEFNEIISSQLFPETYFSEEVLLGFGIFFGFSLILITYGILIYINVWQPLYLWFSIYVFFMAAYIFVLSGLIIDLKSPSFPNSGVAVAIGLFISYVKFFQQLTSTIQYKKRHQWLNRFIYSVLLLSVMYFILPYQKVTILFLRIVFFTTTLLIFTTLKDNPELTKTQSRLMAGSLIFLLLAMIVLAVSQWSNWFLKANLLRWGIVLSALHISWISVSILYRIKKINDTQESLWLDIRQTKKELLSKYLDGVQEEKKRIVAELKNSVLSDMDSLNNGELLTKNEKDELLSIQNRVINITDELESKSQVQSQFLDKIRIFAKEHESEQMAFNVEFYNYKKGLSPNDEKQLFHIIQEGIQNIEMHAKANEVEIQLIKSDNEVILTIEDNGIGFNLNNNKNGIGIRSMHQRAENINANLNIRTTLGMGTSIYVAVSVEK